MLRQLRKKERDSVCVRERERERERDKKSVGNVGVGTNFPPANVSNQ